MREVVARAQKTSKPSSPRFLATLICLRSSRMEGINKMFYLLETKYQSGRHHLAYTPYMVAQKPAMASYDIDSQSHDWVLCSKTKKSLFQRKHKWNRYL